MSPRGQRRIRYSLYGMFFAIVLAFVASAALSLPFAGLIALGAGGSSAEAVLVSSSQVSGATARKKRRSTSADTRGADHGDAHALEVRWA